MGSGGIALLFSLPIGGGFPSGWINHLAEPPQPAKTKVAGIRSAST